MELVIVILKQNCFISWRMGQGPILIQSAVVRVARCVDNFAQMETSHEVTWTLHSKITLWGF